jgi:signal transduction histidine kinase
VVELAQVGLVPRREHDLQGASEFNAVLLAMAAHDLRQPLQLILGAFSWLRQQCSTSREHEYIERGELAICRLTEQLDHLVDALRLHERSTSIALSPVELAPLLDGLCRENVELGRQSGLTVRIYPTRAAVMSDAILLDGILCNLVRNAIKYTQRGGRILVGCRRRGPDVCIEVHDTGIGIPPDHLSKVFDAFHRVDSTQPNGLGLGLFVVRRAVDVLGHHIEVHSTVGRGSCFSILARAVPAAGDFEAPATRHAMSALSLCSHV